ncbi:MAG: FecR domain-containing protein [Pedobacter sp.]
MPINPSIKELFSKYIEGEASVQETTLLFNLIALSENDAEVTDILDAELNDTPFAANYDPAWEAILHQVKAHTAVIPITSTKKSAIQLWTRIAAVAAILLITFATYLFIGRQKESKYAHLLANDLPPGKVGATLTLANGKKVGLKDLAIGEVMKKSGLSISKTADGQVVYQAQSGQNSSNALNTLTTAIGETFILTLPDQTKVWLNAASSLTYNPSLTANGIRKVKLTGEGYFEVAKDKDHPFIVESGNQTVEVLGTHFNVNAYPDEKAYRTTLLEGSVKITDQGHSKILAPGDQAFNSSGNIKLSQVDPEFAVAWKSNNFVFDRLDIKEIMKMISRWYNVEVIYNEEIPSGTFWGSVSRFDNISKVLISLEATGDVHFKIEGRKIYVLR